jgi:hypothetical protein
MNNLIRSNDEDLLLLLSKFDANLSFNRYQMFLHVICTIYTLPYNYYRLM